jgi:hypothetical protein
MFLLLIDVGLGQWNDWNLSSEENRRAGSINDSLRETREVVRDMQTKRL